LRDEIFIGEDNELSC